MADNHNIEAVREKLIGTLPIHDTPIGVIHPYWARKPMNIIDELILAFSDPGDLILDPFMGSGTVIFSAIKNRRKAIGTDINPLAVLIVEELINLSSSPSLTEKLLAEFVAKIQGHLLPLFKINSDRFLERERFEVIGDFEYGKFQLKSIETISKELKNGKWCNRRLEDQATSLKLSKEWEYYVDNPVSFSSKKLLKNSRIAIPEGATLADFYTTHNKICINFMLNFLQNSKLSDTEKRACKFLISSSLPLLRLSDKKASSQWPYWRPKNSLTSRNPLIVLQDRLNKIVNGTKWLKETGIFGKTTDNIAEVGINRPYIAEIAIQDLPNRIAVKPKLILTDPPYSDHVPYLEYSAIWNEILGFRLNSQHFSKEIVNSDAPARRHDTLEYQKRISEALKICAELIDPNGIIVWFYQDQNLKNWEILYEQAQRNGVHIVDVIAISKQRRSMKSVTSPNSTLDGDLIVLFSKKSVGDKRKINKFSQVHYNETATYFDKYASIVRAALINGSIKDLSKRYKNVNEIIKNNNVLAFRH